ncbi:MAG: SMI1/KNR4 family protein [Actinomycetaceae bacterium]|nr:SMI1/KNR4 family protein [Actinomycetaceae bacterium]
MSIVDEYISGLEAAYRKVGRGDEWDDYFRKMGPRRAAEEDLQAIRELYPLVPQTLLDLLTVFNGTHWQEHPEDGRLSLFSLNSDVDDGTYPYYLFSASEIVENKDSAQNYADYIDRLHDPEEELLDIGEEIGTNSKETLWLHFADCMNGGGSSKLFIDFTPSPRGVVGQVVRYVHDPDDLSSIADSFDEYLRQVIDSGYNFIHADY